MEYIQIKMKSLTEYIIESLNEAKKTLAYTNEELLQIAKNYSNKYSKLMVGTENEDAHAYVKPNDFSGKFFDKINLDSQPIMLLSGAQKDLIESLANACPELIVIFRTYEGIDTRSIIRNLGRHYYQICLPSTGMLFNSIKEAKDFIKEHPYLKNPKKAKCIPMTCKEAFNEYQERTKTYREFGPVGKGLGLCEQLNENNLTDLEKVQYELNNLLQKYNYDESFLEKEISKEDFNSYTSLGQYQFDKYNKAVRDRKYLLKKIDSLEFNINKNLKASKNGYMNKFGVDGYGNTTKHQQELLGDYKEDLTEVLNYMLKFWKANIDSF